MAPLKRQAYDAEFKLKAVSHAAEHGNRAAARQFNIHESMVRNWRKQQDDLRRVKKTKKSFRGRKARWLQLEDKLHQWVIEQRAAGRRVSTVSIRMKATVLASELNISEFRGGPSWCFRFMRRRNISIGTRTTRQLHTDYRQEEKMDSVRGGYCKNKITDQDVTEHVINMDQVPLTFGIPVSCTVDTTGALTPALKPESQSSPVNSNVPVKEESQSWFETPQKSCQPPLDGAKSRRALNFFTGEEQVSKDRMKAEIQLQIRSRLQQMSEVVSCVKTCKGSLDVEWLEINSVFTEVINVVEEARQRALLPLENRRTELKGEANAVIEKLQEDIEELEQAMEEVDTAAELDTAVLTKLRSRDCSFNTSFSSGSLRATISNTMEQIQQELEKLTAVEMKRMASFAVDVKLNPDTADQWLMVFKEEQDVQDDRQVYTAPGSRFSSGRSYWEVEVDAETDWDLGVVSTKANGEDKRSPNNGFWSIAHYQGGKYAALTAPPVCLELKDEPQKVGVFFDYEEGLVSFYNVTAQTHIHSFTNCCFDDEIFPYIRVSTGGKPEPFIIGDVFMRLV